MSILTHGVDFKHRGEAYSSPLCVLLHNALALFRCLVIGNVNQLYAKLQVGVWVD